MESEVSVHVLESNELAVEAKLGALGLKLRMVRTGCNELGMHYTQDITYFSNR